MKTSRGSAFRRLVAAVAIVGAVLPAAAAEARPRTVADLGFDPVEHGFSFENYGNEGNVQNLTPIQMQWLFGSAVCVSGAGPTCVLSPPAARFLKVQNAYMADGHCEGMSVAALMLFKQLVPAAGLGAADVPQLELDANPTLSSFIAYAYAFQVLRSVERRVIWDTTPMGIVRRLVRNLNRREKQWSIHIFKRDGSGGHSMTPTGVVRLSRWRWAIRVYDNNWAKQTRSIVVDARRNRWTYFAAANPKDKAARYVGTKHSSTLQLENMTPGLGVQPCPFCKQRPRNRRLGGTQTPAPMDGQVSVSLTGDARRGRHNRLLVSDAKGRRIGQDGRRFVDRFPGASVTRMTSGGVAVWNRAPENIYHLPAQAPLQVRLTGSATGTTPQSISLLGNGATAAVDGITGDAAGSTVAAKPDLSGVSVKTSAETGTQSPVVTLGATGADGKAYSVTVIANELPASDGVGLSLDPSTGKVAIQPPASTTGPTTLDLTIVKDAPDGGKATFVREDVPVQVAQTTTVEAASLAPGTTSLPVQTGSGAPTQLGNQAPAAPASTPAPAATPSPTATATATGSPSPTATPVPTPRPAPAPPAITRAPAQVSADREPSIAFTGGDRCALDGAEGAECSSPARLGPLPDGRHEFAVRNGNGPATTAGWTVDTSVPQILTGPPGSTTDAGATFTFDHAQAAWTFQCRLDRGTYEPCTSPTGYSPLASGPHRFDVRAVDADGVVTSAATQEWTVADAPSVDGLAPESLRAGARDATVTIRGAGFAPGATVAFADPVAAVTDAAVVDAHTIVARVSASTAGRTQLVVTNRDGGQARAPFTVMAAPGFDLDKRASATSKAIMDEPGLAAYFPLGRSFIDAVTGGPTLEGHGATFDDGGPWRTGGTVFDPAQPTWLTVSQNPFAAGSSFTWEGWIAWNGPGAGLWQRVFDFGNGPGEYMTLMAEASDDPHPRFEMRSPVAPDHAENLTSSVALPTGSWHHLAVTQDAATVTLFFDGRQVARRTDFAYLPTDIGATQDNFVGRSQYVADAFFDGSQAGVAMYDRALSDATIADHVAAASPVSPATVTAGDGIDVTISGSGFDDGAAVAFDNPAVSVGDVRRVDDGHLVATITVAPDADTGSGGVTVTNPDGSVARSPIGLSVLPQP